MNTTKLPVVTNWDFHIASPLPGRTPKSGRTSATDRTSAPQRRARPAVSSLDKESITINSSTSGTPRISSVPIRATTAPTEPCTLRAGMTTLTRSPWRVFARNISSAGQSAAVVVRSSNQRAASGFTYLTGRFQYIFR
jgi:hypothetical protein